MGLDVFTTAIAGLVTALLGLITCLLTAGYRERERRQHEEIEKLAETYSARVQAELEAQRARTVELIAEKVPPTADIPQLVVTLRSTISDMVVRAQREERDARPDSSWAIVKDLVQGYHRQALDQAKVQFCFSVAAATVGFALIIFMVTTATSVQNADFISKVFPGAIILSVAALFFRQAGETSQRAAALYDRLRSDNQKRRAFELVADIEDQTVRSVVKAEMALDMAGLEVDKIDVAGLVPKLRNPSVEAS
jgi:Cyanobacterial TRADD-N associated 2-Transmembrane domain